MVMLQDQTMSYLCISCIMYPSDLPDMYIQAQGVGVHIRQIMRVRDTTDMYHDCRLIASGGRPNTRAITGPVI